MFDREDFCTWRGSSSRNVIGCSTTTLIINEMLETSKDITGDLEENHLETKEDLDGDVGKLYLWPLAMKADALPEQRESHTTLQDRGVYSTC